jgi:hypothetical protein
MRAMCEISSGARLLFKGRSHWAKGKNARGRVLFFLCAWLVVFCAPGFAQGRNTRVVEVPPQPQDTEAKVKRGESVDITLRIYGRASQQTQFRIKTQPELGKLSDLRATSPGSAVVTYTHSGKAAPLHDHFTFVAQTSAGVSAPADVDITIEDDAPILAVPDEIDFGSVKPGVSVTRQITIENRGGSVVEGTVGSPDGWQVSEPIKYHLDHGEKQNFTITFTPKEEQIYRGELSYSSSPDRVTSLRGEGAPPVAIKPATVELRMQPGSTARSGMVTIENHTGSAEKATVEAGEQIGLSQTEFEVPANGKVALTVGAAPDNPGAFDGKISARIADISLSADVRVPAIGPILRTNANRLSLGKVESGKLITGMLRIENGGGTGTRVDVTSEDPFSIAASDQTFTLAAGTQRVIHISFAPKYDGAFNSRMWIKAGSGTLEIPLEGEGVRELGFPRASVSSPISVASATPPSRSFVSLLSLNPFAQSQPPQPTGPDLLNVQWKWVAPREAEFEWHAPDGSPSSFQIETRKLSLDEQHKMKIDWLPLKNVQITVANSVVTARLKDLQPDTLYIFRIVPVNAEPAGIIQLRTPPVTHTSGKSWLLLVMFVVLVVLVWRRFFPRAE